MQRLILVQYLYTCVRQFIAKYIMHIRLARGASGGPSICVRVVVTSFDHPLVALLGGRKHGKHLRSTGHLKPECTWVNTTKTSPTSFTRKEQQCIINTKVRCHIWEKWKKAEKLLWSGVTFHTEKWHWWKLLLMVGGCCRSHPVGRGKTDGTWWQSTWIY